MLIFCDGFDHYRNLSLKWSGVVNDNFGVIPQIVPGHGRFASDALFINNKFQRVQIDFGPQATFIVGAAYYADTNVPTFGQCVFSLWNGGVMELALYVDHTNVLWVYNGVTQWYASHTIRCNTWEYIELKATASLTVGSVIVHLNGAEVLNRSNVRTCAQTYYSGISMAANWPESLGWNDASTHYFDDVYVCDTVVGDNVLCTDFLGDVRIEELLPNADGSYQEFTRDVPGADHYGRVNEKPPNEDTSYVYSNTLGNIDTYTFPSITPASDATIYACVVNFETKKLESGIRGLSCFGTMSGTSANGTEERITTAYAIYQSFMEMDPSGATWTKANVEASEFGPEITT